MTARSRSRKRHDREPLKRSTDEVRAWLGDEEAEQRREVDEHYRRGRSTVGGRGGRWPGRDGYTYAGETILGRADWGVPSTYEGPGVVRRREPLWRSYAGRGPRNSRRTDERIREDICERFTEDPRVDAFDIEVRVKDGEVTLTGNVTSRDQKRRAEDVAASVSGVSDVINELRIAPL